MRLNFALSLPEWNIPVLVRLRRRYVSLLEKSYTVVVSIANTCCNGYPHDGPADNASYRHDCRADNAAYRHDRRVVRIASARKLAETTHLLLRPKRPTPKTGQNDPGQMIHGRNDPDSFVRVRKLTDIQTLGQIMHPQSLAL